MKTTTKTTLSLSICLSLLFGTQANTQAVPVARYGVNAWLSAETIAATTVRRAAANDARYWPATAANDASFKVAQANTITSMQAVAKTEAVAARGLSGTDLITMAGLATMSVAGAPAWLTLLVTAGVIGVDINNLFNINDINSSSSVNLTLKTTPAGIRVEKKYKINNPIINPSSSNSAVAFASKFGAIVASSNCSSVSFCSAFPTANQIDLRGYLFYTAVQSASTQANPSPYRFTDTVPNLYVYFSTSDLALSYIKSLPPYSFNSLTLHYDAYNTYDVNVGPISKPAINYIYNSDFTNLIIQFSPNFHPAFYYDSSNYILSESYGYINNLRLSSVDYDGQYYTQSHQIRSYPYIYSTPYIDSISKNVGKISLSQADLNAVASPDLMAGLLNKLWLKASQQPDYRGLPYSPTNPVTVPELSPRVRPALNDLLQEVLNPQGEVVLSEDGVNPAPIVVDNPDTQDPNFCKNNPTHKTCTATKDIDLSAPDAVEPQLEIVPTVFSILRPLLDLITPYRSFTVSKPATECPTSSFEALDRQWVLDAHCGMFESVRDLLSAVMLTVFAVASFRIVMKA